MEKITLKLNNNSLTSLISLTIGSLKEILPQILRYFYYGLMFYFIFASIMSLVGTCASLVDCLSVLPYGFSGFDDSVLLMNNRGNPDNSGFIISGTPNTPSVPCTPGGGINRGGFRGVFKDYSFSVGCVIGSILVWWCYDYIWDSVYLSVFIYKFIIGVIIGVCIRKFIEIKFSLFRWDKGDKNKKVKSVSIVSTVIIIVLINIIANGDIGFDLINRVYCDNEDDVVVTDAKNSNIEKDDDSYHFSISKKFVKEGFDSVLKVLSDSFPEIIGGLGGAKIATAVVKGSNSELGVGDDLVVKVPRASLEELLKGETGGDEFVKKTARKLVEFESSKNGGSGTDAGTSTGTGSTCENLNNVMDKGELGRDVSNLIPSLLDGNLSPLEILINCEILINIMILVHIILLVLILIQKFNIKIIKKNSVGNSVGFIRKFLNKYKLNKVQNFIIKVGEMSNKYLSVLIIINVIIIIFYIFLNVYINIELSSNLNEYISVYNKIQFKEGAILLLLKCNIKRLLKCNIKSKLFSCSNINNRGKKMIRNKYIKSNVLQNEDKISESNVLLNNKKN